MDINEALKQSEAGATLYLKDQHGNPAKKDDGNPVWIKLAGTNSARWREASDAIGDRRLKRAGTKTGTAAKSMQEFREDQCQLYAAVTLEWDGIKVGGEMWPCTQENAKKLYLHAKFIYDQVEEFVGDLANF